MKAVWPLFFLALYVCLFILNLLFFSLQFVDFVFKYDAGLVNCLRLLLYYQPSLLVLAIPIAYLAAILITFGRLSSDREAMALETAGVSPAILIWPMLGVSLIMSVLLVFIMDIILPWGNVSFMKLNYQILSERAAIIVRERTFIDDFDRFILYVQEKDDRHDLLKGVTVECLDEKGHAYRLIQARQGTLRKDPKNFQIYLDLNDGILQQEGKGPKEKTGEFMDMQYKNCSLNLTAYKLRPGQNDYQDARNIHMGELLERIREKKKLKTDTRYDEVEFHKKFSLPFSALAFAFIGIPLGLIFRTSSIVGAVVALALVVIYDLFILYGQEGGPSGAISPFLAMWLPNWVLMAIGGFMIFWLNHRLDFWQSLLRRKPKDEPDFQESELSVTGLFK